MRSHCSPVAAFVACVLLVVPLPSEAPADVRSVIPDRDAVQSAPPGAVRSASLSGTVTLPPRRNERRRFRGRAYRQRTNRGDETRSAADASSRKGRYRNVIVSAHALSHDPAVDPLPEPVEIDQNDASFVPHVTPITPGTTVEFVNSDPFYHNVFSLTPGARFNIGRRPTGVVVEERMPRIDGEVPGVGVVELHCDIHPQMNAFIVSLDTPYFTRVGEDGTYRLDSLPAGRYRIQAYMPRQEVVSFEVDLDDGEHASRPIDLR